MLRITKITDYGFILLSHMANQEKNLLHNAKDLSAAIGIPLPTVSKVLKILTQGGILKSHQGSKGGYSLSRPAKDITAASIIEAVEGPVAITDCSSAEGCERNCPVSPSWQQVNSAVINTLQGLTLADMSNS
ncbi:SUF system Fe-S cluster assembly regulator [Pontiella sulfatireligans]|uniref:HTH-type transcriptional regulator n=1 Tax=Pontiella sulfatireligans TaxID=2750658 RepID=A0A6C2UFK8_9BACT|nr:SUF system Fe-S cluster assembly regulator [Pontiella sulfatireligans]VGO17986.1 Putative HTH-type transcriptional regulator [Pontiella sulfatireligans]